MAGSTLRAVAALALAVATCGTAFAAQQQEQLGQFALYRGTPQIRSDVRLIGGNVLQIVQYPLHGNAAITRYRNSESEPVHVVLVRDDFRSFSHVHPQAVSNGIYRVRVALDAGHRYYAFVGSRPAGYTPQVFRFVLQAGAPPHHSATSFEAPSERTTAGPYRVTLSNAHLSAYKFATIVASVTTNAGRAVATRPFRGALAHTVFVNVQTLEYVHVDAPQDGRIELRLPPLRRGAYRMWLEFSDGHAIFAAPFRLAAQ
jgi:hypothetical protein